jgi:hypothetical protein
VGERQGGFGDMAKKAGTWRENNLGWETDRGDAKPGAWKTERAGMEYTEVGRHLTKIAHTQKV